MLQANAIIIGLIINDALANIRGNRAGWCSNETPFDIAQVRTDAEAATILLMISKVSITGQLIQIVGMCGERMRNATLTVWDGICHTHALKVCAIEMLIDAKSG